MHNSYGMTVQELLELDILKESKVLAGREGLNRRITKVNIMEVPDIINWVEKNEFILTAAYSLRNDVQKLDDLICNLNKKGISGIGIKTKRYIQKIPQNIIKRADELSFPIIELPYDISFSEIITPAFTQIVNRQASLLSKIEKFNSKIIDTMLKGGGLNEIAQTMYENIGNSICIRENLFKTNVIASDEDKRVQIEDIVIKDNYNKNTVINTNLDSNLNVVVTDEINGKSVRRIIIPIRTDGRNYGSIYVWEDNRKLSSVEINVVQASLPIIALELLKKLSVFNIESRQKIEFFDDLFSQDKDRHKHALEKAYYFNFDKRLTYCVIILKMKNMSNIVKNTPNNSSFLTQLNEILLSIIERVSKDRKEKILYGGKSDRLIILFGEEKTEDEKKIKKDSILFSKEIMSYAKTEHIDKNISIGIGRSYKNIDKLWQSYREAKRAADNDKLFEKNAPVHYDDLGLYRILSFEEIQPELIKLYKEVLGDLIQYDVEKGTNLIDTLENYFIYAGNVKKVSKAMYTHYNTIIYRISRIEEIIGLKLDDYNDRLNIQIALKVYNMIKNNNMTEKY